MFSAEEIAYIMAALERLEMLARVSAWWIMAAIGFSFYCRLAKGRFRL